MKNTCSFLFLLLISSLTYAQSAKHVLFIGNSYTATNNLPQLVADVAESAGDTLYFDSNAPGGYTFEMHTTNTATINAIAAGTWDYVVLQEQSQIPSFSLDEVETLCFPFAAELDMMIREANVCTETLFFMTWGRKDGDATNCPFWPPVCTYAGMDSLLRERYMMMGADNDAEVSPVGAVWHYIRDTHPEIELYVGDGSHPSAAGSYAAACCFYAAIFQEDPTAITYDYTLTAEQAAIIRAAAKTIVFDDLSAWYIGTYFTIPEAGFTSLADAPLTLSFSNTSTDAIRYEWQFGDGITSTEENPSHTYPGIGDYLVSLIAYGCDTLDVFSTMVHLETETNHITDATSGISIYPNPVTDILRIQSAQPILSIGIFDMMGNRLSVEEMTLQQQAIDVHTLQAGMYLLYIETAQQQTGMYFIKN